MSFLDLLFPKHCVGCKRAGDYICPNCFAQISFDTDSICTVCNRPSFDGITHPMCKGRYIIDGTFAAVSYKRIIRKLVYQLKYKPYLSSLIKALGELCYESLIQNEVLFELLKKKPILIPIPLSVKRLRERGYNQSELLAIELGKRFGLKVQPLLKRVKETKPQYGLKREERKVNMEEAFEIEDRRLKMENIKMIILVDDVLTTGSTMSEAAKVLKKNGIKEVWGVALAKD